MAVNRLQQGNETFFVAFAHDITERRQAEQILREERDFSTQVLQTADALIIVLDPEGRIVRFNGMCATVFGYEEGELLGMPFWELLVPPPLVPSAQELFDRLVRERVPQSFEQPWLTRFDRSDLSPGATRPFRILMGTCVSSSAPALTSPTSTAWRNSCDMPRRWKPWEPWPEESPTISTISSLPFWAIFPFCWQNSGRRMKVSRNSPILNRRPSALAELTHGLLTFSRRTTGRTQTLNINRIIAEVDRLLQRVLPTSIKIELQTEPDLWMVNADSTQLHQLLMNLSVNARDAMPQGGTLTLRTANRVLGPEDCRQTVEARPGEFVELTVSDNGVGMSADVRRQIFDPFFTTKDVGQGTGLGLAIVFGIVKAHGGWISVNTNPGRGTTLAVYFPRAQWVNSAPLPPPPAPLVRGKRMYSGGR